MANIEEAIRRLKFLYEQHGAEEVARAQAAITASTTDTERASLSLEKSFGNLERRYVSAVRAQQDYQRVQDKVNDAIRQNPALQERGNVILQNAQQQYLLAARGMQAYGTALNKGTGEARLARHELINLSRQIQDVGVGLASGQSPFTILVQQGSQIADVFATSTGTLRGFFTQAGAWALRFIGSTAGIVTAVAGLGTAFIASAVSFASAQRDIERALAATGRASGVTRDQINEIAKASASAFGISTKEAQEAATAFAATGRVQAENVAKATQLIDQYAKAGENAEEKTKELGKALLDPAKGFLEMSKSLDFLSVQQLENIQRMQAAGDMAGAQRAGMEALNTKLQEMSKHTGTAAKGWNLIANAMSEWWRSSGSVGLAGGGLDTTGLQKQLADAQRVLEMRQKMFGPVGAAQDAARAEVERLTKAIADLDKAGERAGLEKLTLQANAVAAAVLPATAQIRAMEEALNKLRDARIATGGPVTGAETVLNVALQQEKEKEASLIRQAEYVQQLQAKYVGMSIEGAKQLNNLQAQLPVIQARTGAEKIVAQEIARQVQLYGEGKSRSEQLAISAAERRNAEAAVAAAIEQQIQGLDQQYQLMKASSPEEAARVKAAQAYQKAIDDGADAMKASEVASKTLRNEMEQIAQNEQKAAEAAEQRGNVIQVNSAAIQAENAAIDALISSAQKLAYEWQNVAGALVSIDWEKMEVVLSKMGNVKTWMDESGQRTQFNPEGYVSQLQITDPAIGNRGRAALEELFGAGGLSTVQIRDDQSLNVPTAAGVGNLGYRLLEGQPVSDAGQIQSLFGRTLGMGFQDPRTADVLSRLVGIASDDQKKSLLEQEIAAVMQTPSTLAREELLKSLNDQLKALTDATGSLEDQMKASLDPLFSQGHEFINTLRIGFYKAAEGGVFGPGGRIPLMPINRYAGGGIANSPQMAMFGEAGPEAFVPLKSGAIPVKISGGASNDNSRTVTQNINVTFTGAETPQRRLTARQMAQSFGAGATKAAMRA